MEKSWIDGKDNGFIEGWGGIDIDKPGHVLDGVRVI